MPSTSLRMAAGAVGLMACVVAISPAGAQPPTAAPPVAPPLAIAGVWVNDTGKGAIEIGPCGDKLCGSIVWLKDPNDKSGKPLTDGYNPEASKRRRPICGLQVIGDVKRISANIWDKGWIYDPEEGKSYDVELKLKSPDRLSVTGYIGTKFLSETFVWTRAPENVLRCTTPAGLPAGAAPAPQATAR